MIPIIDIFAGPGGLGEGFSSYEKEDGKKVFKIKLSIEKDFAAHQTLKLRSFFRQFDKDNVPDEYYEFVRNNISLEELYNRFPDEAALAAEEACCGTLGEPDEGDLNVLTNQEVDKKIRKALNGNTDWLLIGGPPCQAYSLVGRSRRQEKKLDEKKDKRVGLYKEYLRIIAVHKPTVFVMENVKGLLSAQTKKEFIFHRILEDLSDPVKACLAEGYIKKTKSPAVRYRIYSLTTEPKCYDRQDNPILEPNEFIIKAENYGVPQRRHRVILLGVREDITAKPAILDMKDQISLKSVIDKLPKIRSGITKTYTHSTEEIINNKKKKKRHYKKIADSVEKWSLYFNIFDKKISKILDYKSENINNLPLTMGEEFIDLGRNTISKSHSLWQWYHDERLQGVMHHKSRMHLLEDVKRYLFASRYAEINGNFPRLEDYKSAGKDFMPDHENAESGKFTDRFRVQLPDIPATTVTSHISKDGHYFIHYDPKQSRSFTVREAARVQTFPDNYYFCGGRTQQFHQVGNAVPPYLAYQIAEVVAEIFGQIPIQNNEVIREQHF